MDILSQQCPNIQSTGTANQLVSLLFHTIITSYCDLSTQNSWPEDFGPQAVFNRNKEYDFIIVGAGSSGSVVANRLSENSNWNILLIEAGDNPPVESEIPLLHLTLQHSKYDWQYYTEPGEKSCLGYKNERCYLARGKMLGGSSSMNDVNYIRGTRKDFDSWEAEGNPSWEWDHVMKYFRKAENISTLYANDSEYGKNGPLNLDYFSENSNFYADMITEAAKENGHEQIFKFNSSIGYNGYDRVLGTLYRGKRQSSARAYLAPIRNRKNLHVIKNAVAKKILFNDNKKAVGIELIYFTTNITLYVNKEIILSAGPIATPQILMLSGIGPSSILRQHQIPVIKDLAVGQNLQDHLYVPIFFKLKNPNSNIESQKYLIKNTFNYLIDEPSILSSIQMKGFVGFVNTNNYSDINPDIEYNYVYLMKKMSDMNNWLTNKQYKDEIMQTLKEINEEFEILVVLVILLKPLSKGMIMLNSIDYKEYPKIYTNYFDDNNDIETILRGIKYKINFEQTKSFKNNAAKLIQLNIAECNSIEYKTDNYWKCYIKYVSGSLNNHVGTAKMGPINDTSAVVDQCLKVYGLKGLRVADASIMPKILTGNTNAATIMIGEKVSDFIKNKWAEGK